MLQINNKVLYLYMVFNIHNYVYSYESETQLKYEYHKYNIMTKFLEDFALANSDLATLHSIGRSVQNRELWVMILDKPSSEKNKANIKLIANIHGNEAVGREVLLHFIKYLVDNQDKDEKINHLLKYNRIHILPSMNPDAFEVSKEICDSNTGRKNVREYDLNRNFPGVFRPNPCTIQPETKAILDWMENTTFILSASLHGGALVANYPYDAVEEEHTNLPQVESKTPDDEVFKHLALTYSKSHPKMHKGTQLCKNYKAFKEGITNGANWYILQGGMQDYNYKYKGCMEITLEISCCKYPEKSQLEKLWEENKKPLVEFCLQAGLGVKGTVFDISTNKTIPRANLTVRGINMTFLTDKDGKYYRLLVPGTYLLQVSAENYKKTWKKFTINEVKKYPIMITHDIYLMKGTDSSDVQYPEVENTSIETADDTTIDSDNYNTPYTQKVESTKSTQMSYLTSDQNDVKIGYSKSISNEIWLDIILFLCSILTTILRFVN